jgi:hypothetical protein
MSSYKNVIHLLNYKNEPIKNNLNKDILNKLCNNEIPLNPVEYKKLIETSTYKFSLPITELVNNSTKPYTPYNKRVNKIYNQTKAPTNPPRPPNKWIIYSKNKSTELRKIEKYKHIKAKEMQKITSQLWKNETEEVKSLFGHMEKYAKLLHREKYGEDYVYKPQKTTQKKRPPKNAQEPEYRTIPEIIIDLRGIEELGDLGEGHSGLIK